MAIDNNKLVERSVDSVARIYAVVIGLALSEAVKTLITKDASGNPELNANIVWAMPAFISFLVTLVPFWHGMNRHLDLSYLEKDGDVAEGALLLDFSVFFIEASLFLVAGWAVRSGLLTFYCLGSILLLDTLWAFVSHWIHRPGKPSHSKGWSVINAITIGAGVLVVTFQFDQKPVGLAVLAVARSIADYARGWKFYFPRSVSAAEK